MFWFSRHGTCRIWHLTGLNLIDVSIDWMQLFRTVRLTDRAWLAVLTDWRAGWLFWLTDLTNWLAETGLTGLLRCVIDLFDRFWCWSLIDIPVFQAQFKVEKLSETTNMIECEGIGFENNQLWTCTSAGLDDFPFLWTCRYTLCKNVDPLSVNVNQCWFRRPPRSVNM